MSSHDLLLLFEAGGRSFAVPAAAVREIVPLSSAGEVVLLDLSHALGGAATPAGERTCVIVLQATLGESFRPAGIVADVATDVLVLSPGDLIPPPDFGPRVRLQYLSALVRRDGGYAIVLDVDRLLTVHGRAEVA